MAIKQGLDNFMDDYLKTDEGRSKLKQKQDEVHRLTIALNQAAKHNNSTVLELPVEGDSIKFGLIGDTHIGSVSENLGALKNFYDICENEDIETVLHAGDIIDGHGIYKGQIFEQHKVGWDAQYKYFKDAYPYKKNIITHFITGNHDLSFTKIVGIDVGMHFQEARDDFRFIDNESGVVNFKTESDKIFSVGLQHPGGGSSYSISYKTQKIIDALEGGTKPNLLGIGHFHKAEMLPNYRNLCGVQVGTFQNQSPFMARNALQAMVGGWIVKFSLGNGVNSIEAKFIAYY